MAVDIVARALAIKNAGGTGETIDYNQLTNKPQINNIELVGNKTLDELGIQAKGDYALVDDVDAQISELQGQIPTNTSQLTNDSDYTTNAYVNGLVGDINTVLATLTTVSEVE